MARIRRRYQLLTATQFRDQFLEHENFQLVNYGPGGSLRIHQDTSPFPFTSRLATFMVYLSSVQGGHTVFPVHGISEAALTGDALLWYGQRSDGEADSGSLHLACPVLYGNKWVVNMGVNVGHSWEGGQERGREEQWVRLPCRREGRHYPALGEGGR